MWDSAQPGVVRQSIGARCARARLLGPFCTPHSGAPFSLLFYATLWSPIFAHLVKILVGDYREGARVIEHMVMLVDSPHGGEVVTEVVVEEFEEIGANKNDEKLGDEVARTEGGVHPTVGLRHG